MSEEIKAPEHFGCGWCGRGTAMAEMRRVRIQNPEWGNGIMSIQEHMERDMAAGRYTPSIIEPDLDLLVCPACLAELSR